VRSLARGTAALVLLVSTSAAPRTAAADVLVDAPPSLASTAERLRAFDRGRLTEDLARAGLAWPADIQITVVPEEDARAASFPSWVVGFASGTRDIVIFPERVLAYPYDSLESVLRHEVTHLALSERAGSRPLPRWFHEGVAVSVDAGWDTSSRVQLLLAMRRDPGLANLGRLFASSSRQESALAYRLSAALVADLRRRHGASAPGAIAARVAAGDTFDRAFRRITGDTPEQAAERAWTGYRRWTAWVSAVTGDAMPWAIILALAVLAFIARVRQRARSRARWEDEHDPASPPG
jgi:hypothetical protein